MTQESRSPRQSTVVLVGVIAMSILCSLTLASKAHATSDANFCYQQTLTGTWDNPGWSCLDTTARYLTGVYAQGGQGDVCAAEINGPFTCSHGPSYGVYLPGSGELRKAAIYNTNVAPNLVSGHVWWTGPPPPPSWHNDNLGGSFTSELGISSWSPNRLDVFGRGTDNALWHKYWNGVTWSEWDNGMGANNVVGGPDATSWGPGRIDVVARESNKSVGHWYWTGSTWVHDNLGGVTESDPAVCSWGENRLDVFVRATDGSLQHKYWNGSSWSGWEKVGGPSIVGAPSCVSWGANRIDIVARTTDNSIEHWWDENGSWGWDNLSGVTYYDPAISTAGYHVLKVFVDGTNNALFEKKSTNPGWTNWTQIGGPISGGPAAVSWGGSRVDVVAPNWDAQKSALHFWYE